jgi:hypothetical protein
LACHQWSDHEEWYHDDDELMVEDYLKNPRILQEPLGTPEG